MKLRDDTREPRRWIHTYTQTTKKMPFHSHPHALPIEETRLRLEKVRQEMTSRGAEACIFSTPVNSLYLLGYIVGGYIVVLPEGDPWLFVRRPAGLQGDRVCYIGRPEEMITRIAEEGIPLPYNVALETDSLPYSDITRLLRACGDVHVVSADSIIRTARAIKTPMEIEQMRTCGKIYCRAFAEVPHLYKRGMSDHDFTLAWENLVRSMGHIGIFRTFGSKMEGFMGTSILVGDNADAGSPYDFALGGAGMHPSLPMAANGTVLQEGQTMMVDGGGCFGPYIIDMTRVYALGTLPEIVQRAHQCSIEICHHFQHTARPGMSCAEFYRAALERVTKAGLTEYFMGHQQQAAFVGHGVGLQINELPVLFGRSREKLEAGMTIALEPKFVFPEIGAVGIENTYLITPSGVENLTADAPEEIIYL